LATVNPEFFSVTFGAGGGTRDLTFDTTINLNKETGIRIVPHISCNMLAAEDIAETLNKYKSAGVSEIVALRGDNPSGLVASGEFKYASELVTFIKNRYADDFKINVAAYPEVHPQALSSRDDLQRFRHKVAAGADAAITQYFYNADSYFYFVDRCASVGIDIPIIPGVMPITNYINLERFSRTCGAEIPRWLANECEGLKGDKEALEDFGVEVVSQLCNRLIAGGAPKLHFYSMNQANISLKICANL
jgi:methylenetetrahydrofolate reductase (NADPH)